MKLDDVKKDLDSLIQQYKIFLDSEKDYKMKTSSYEETVSRYEKALSLRKEINNITKETPMIVEIYNDSVQWLKRVYL